MNRPLLSGRSSVQLRPGAPLLPATPYARAVRVNGVSTWILTLCGAFAIATSSCLAATGAGPAADSIVAGATASEAAPDPLQQAAESMAAGRPAEAYARLSALAASRAGDPEFDYLLGLAAIESRQAAAAIAPLRRVLAAEPRFDGARLELARALAATGALEAARREYQTVRDGGASAIARDAASRAMAHPLMPPPMMKRS